MCPISIEMLERMIPPTELVLLRTQKKTQTKPSHVHLWRSALLTEQSVSLYDLQYILCVHFLVLVCLVFFFGQVIKWEYNSVSIYNVFIKFINLEHYLLLHTCQLFVNNQSNLFQM